MRDLFKKGFVGLVGAGASVPAFAALDLSALETSIQSDGAVLVAFGVVLLGVIYAVRMVSWAKKI